MRGLESPRALLAFLSIGLSWLAAGCDRSPSESARPKAPIPRIGYLTSGRCPVDSAGAPFAEGLRAQGHVIGQTIVIECRVSDQTDDQRFRAMAAELIEAKLDLIVAISSTATRALVQLTQTIPIVVLDLETDPVATGLAASLARPGGNVTGIFLDALELNSKLLEVMREFVPGLSRVAVLWDASIDPAPLRAAETASRAIGIQLQTLAVRRPAEFGSMLEAAARGRSGAVMVFQSPLMDVHGAEIAALALERRLPAVGLISGFAKQGGLVSYGPDILELFRYLGSFVDRIVKGARPGELPIERPTRLYLAINLKTAKTLGVTVPASLRARADQLIE